MRFFVGMIELWNEKDILITVKTYPEYSSKYTETVCTAGILKDSRSLVRLYPIKFRYLEGRSQFKKYQWIKAKIKKATSDNRPESYNVKDDSIILGPEIKSDSSGWQEREKWLLRPQNVFPSLESLVQNRENANVSLGIVKPKEVIDFRIQKKSENEIKDSYSKKNAIMAQMDMLQEKKDLDIIPVKFSLRFSCDSEKCNKVHNISILDWEISELYRRIKNDANWKEKIRDKVMNDICGKGRETYLILGNMALHQHIFCILGFFWPPLNRQLKLF
jgi:hypothetical protein